MAMYYDTDFDRKPITHEQHLLTLRTNLLRCQLALSQNRQRDAIFRFKESKSAAVREMLGTSFDPDSYENDQFEEYTDAQLDARSPADSDPVEADEAPPSRPFVVTAAQHSTIEPLMWAWVPTVPRPTTAPAAAPPTRQHPAVVVTSQSHITPPLLLSNSNVSPTPTPVLDSSDTLFPTPVITSKRSLQSSPSDRSVHSTRSGRSVRSATFAEDVNIAADTLFPVPAAVTWSKRSQLSPSQRSHGSTHSHSGPPVGFTFEVDPLAPRFAVHQPTPAEAILLTGDGTALSAATADEGELRVSVDLPTVDHLRTPSPRALFDSVADASPAMILMQQQQQKEEPVATPSNSNPDTMMEMGTWAHVPEHMIHSVAGASPSSVISVAPQSQQSRMPPVFDAQLYETNPAEVAKRDSLSSTMPDKQRNTWPPLPLDEFALIGTSPYIINVKSGSSYQQTKQAARRPTPQKVVYTAAGALPGKRPVLRSKTGPPNVSHQHLLLQTVSGNKVRTRSSPSLVQHLQRGNSVRHRKQEELRREQAAVQIQKVAKGFIARKEYNRIQKMYRLRARVASEIYSTEVRFGSTLQLLMQVVVEPLQEQQAIDGMVIAAVFGQVPAIIQISELLQEELAARIASWDRNSIIGDVFVTMAPFLKAFSAYCSNYAAALELLRTLYHKELPQALFIEATTQLGQTLEAVMITPVQRIPRYRLLLTELVKATPDNHPDYAKCKQALAQVEQIAVGINENIRTGERLAKVRSLARQVVGLETSLIQRGRLFLREALLSETFNGRDPVRRFFVLFSDALLCADEPTFFTQKYKCRYLWDLRKVQIAFVSLPSAHIALDYQNDTSELEFDSAESAKAWLMDIDAAITNLNRALK
eukprot:TRINITY_DN2350_c0_g1_i1.p1 TRINITY_DN2350_c0_g1~~TRINITY_DN2350_c0_g1_i1.p1  ORF type:complete len:872 (+),score=211.01 TRINITY_DN2350_c0_g1_i1:120-2735(+)